MPPLRKGRGGGGGVSGGGMMAVWHAPIISRTSLTPDRRKATPRRSPCQARLCDARPCDYGGDDDDGDRRHVMVVAA